MTTQLSSKETLQIAEANGYYLTPTEGNWYMVWAHQNGFMSDRTIPNVEDYHYHAAEAIRQIAPDLFNN